eukprot:5495530-Alexandrium_andersonii.AAC.1
MQSSRSCNPQRARAQQSKRNKPELQSVERWRVPRVRAAGPTRRARPRARLEVGALRGARQGTQAAQPQLGCSLAF